MLHLERFQTTLKLSLQFLTLWLWELFIFSVKSSEHKFRNKSILCKKLFSLIGIAILKGLHFQCCNKYIQISNKADEKQQPCRRTLVTTISIHNYFLFFAQMNLLKSEIYHFRYRLNQYMEGYNITNVTLWNLIWTNHPVQGKQ